jgi:hypothetical protein
MLDTEGCLLQSVVAVVEELQVNISVQEGCLYPLTVHPKLLLAQLERAYFAGWHVCGQGHRARQSLKVQPLDMLCSTPLSRAWPFAYLLILNA